MEIVGMIAEDSQVAVEAQTDAELMNGKQYDNAYHFVFVIRDDLISEVREYCCSYLVEDCFGEFNPNNPQASRSEEHTSELQSLMRISYAVFCLKKKQTQYNINKKI